jgi:hypothetical protein
MKEKDDGYDAKILWTVPYGTVDGVQPCSGNGRCHHTTTCHRNK